MLDAAALGVHDVSLSDVPSFGTGGQIKTMKRLTFYVGSHGPFFRTYTQEEATTEKMQSDINSQVQQIRILEGIGSGA